MQNALILVAAEDSDFRMSLVFALEAEGFQLKVMGMNDIAAIAAEAQSTDFLVIEHRLTGCDGILLLQTLREQGLAHAAIVISAFVPDHLQRQIAAAGATWIEKPILGDALVTTIRGLIQTAVQEETKL